MATQVDTSEIAAAAAQEAEGSDVSSEDEQLVAEEKRIKQSLIVESGEGNEEDSTDSHGDIGRRVRTVVRYVAAFLLASAILVSTTASKLSFAVVMNRFRSASNVTGFPSPPSSPTAPHSAKTELGLSFACIFLFVLLPHAAVLLLSLWSGTLGKKVDNFPWPTKSALMWGLLSSLFESVGIVLFVLEVAVDLSPPLALLVMNGVFCFALFSPFHTLRLSCFGKEKPQVFYKAKDKAFRQKIRYEVPVKGSEAARKFSESLWKQLLRWLAVLMQLVALISIPILVSQKSPLHSVRQSPHRLVAMPISVILLAISWSGWMQNRVNACDFKPAVARQRTSRWKSALITSVFKLAFTVASLFIFDKVFKYDAVKSIAQGFRHIEDDKDTLSALLVHLLCAFVSYILINMSAAMTLHRWAMIPSLLLTTPLSVVFAEVLCSGSKLAIHHLGPSGGWWGGYNLCNITHDGLTMNAALTVMACLLYVAEVIYTLLFVWPIKLIPLSKEETLFHSPGYNSIFLEQYVLVNWRIDNITPPDHRTQQFNNQNIQGDQVRTQQSNSQNMHGDQMSKEPDEKTKLRKVFICSTMYREAEHEQENLLRSINKVHDAMKDGRAFKDRLEFESHIFFDGAARGTVLNDFVLQLVSMVEKTLNFKPRDADIYETPYGLQLNWPEKFSVDKKEESDEERLKEGIHFTVHLKDNQKVKNKKRWSQVMYMSYVLDYRCKMQNEAELDDAFILTTDADIVFTYESVKALMDLVDCDDEVGAVCARTHPTGSGPVVWYQIFDYAIGHWFQKPAEHVMGSVMCCPGCFSVFRCKALNDVLHEYSTEVEKAMEFLMKDMGEDRWLCTLLVEKKWRLEYCAVSENTTFCPETFDEFFKQRRRWIPSTIANLSLCVEHGSKIVASNDTVGWWFILYQALMIFSTLIAPGTVLLIISSGLSYAYGWDNITSLVFLILLTFAYGAICVNKKTKKYQLIIAQAMTFIFSILMCAVVVGVIEQIAEDVDQKTCVDYCHLANTSSSYEPAPTSSGCATGFELLKNCTSTQFLGAPIGITSIYLAALTGMFVTAALLHPSEAYCLMHGIWYILLLPAGYIFLFVYSLCNLDSQSWGTREAKVTTAPSDEGKEKGIATKLAKFILTLKQVCGCCGYSYLASTQDDKEASTRPNTPQGTPSGGQTKEKEKAKQPEEQTEEESDESDTDKDQEAEATGFQRRRRWQRAQSTVFGLVAMETRPTKQFLDNLGLGKYADAFEREGYDDASFLVGMKKEDMEKLGMKKSGHKARLSKAIKKLPELPFVHEVPPDVPTWLHSIGLPQYESNFSKAGYEGKDDVENLVYISEDEMRKELKITKLGHIKRLKVAFKFIQYPTHREKRIKKARLALAKMMKSLATSDEFVKEHHFWRAIRQASLKPKAAALGQTDELAQHLEDLRNSAIMAVAVANVLWIVLLSTLATHKRLDIAGTNPLGLLFLFVYGLVYISQFLSMLIHRFITAMHLLADTGRETRPDYAMVEIEDEELYNCPTPDSSSGMDNYQGNYHMQIMASGHHQELPRSSRRRSESDEQMKIPLLSGRKS